MTNIPPVVAAAQFPTPIGWCGVVIGPRGLTRVLLSGGGEAAMAARLRRAAPGAQRNVMRCRRAAMALAQYFRRGGTPAPGPIDLSAATPWERRVYRVLRRIPAGRVVTYAELAGRAGRPRAARAVGRAMACNPLPVVIPCHRVVRSDGALGGFSCPGGVKLKQWLLAWERQVAAIPHRTAAMRPPRFPRPRV